MSLFQIKFLFHQHLAQIEQWIEKHNVTLNAIGVIAIPVVLAAAALSYERNLQKWELERTQQQAVTNYLNQVTTILLEIEGDLHAVENKRLQDLTTAITLTLLRDPDLDESYRGQIIRHLFRMNLIQKNEGGPFVALNHVDLRKAELRKANLRRVNFHKANLANADLRDADR